MQKLVCAVIAMCNCPRLISIEESNEDLRRRLRNESERPLLDVITDPILALHDSVSETMDIEYFERSFIVSRLLRPGRSLRLWVRSFLPVRSFTVFVADSGVSASLTISIQLHSGLLILESEVVNF